MYFGPVKFFLLRYQNRDLRYTLPVKTKILTENDLEEAAALLKSGELVAFPTETVYGLGAPIFAPHTIQKIFLAKQRPQDNPLIAHVSDIGDCHRIAQNLPDVFFQLAEAFFPGPLTLIVQKHPEIPNIVSASLDTIAIRMPKHRIAQQLIKLAGEPLVAPSANLSGRPSSTQATHVLTDFNGKIGAIIDGGSCLHGMESTVLDLVSFDKPTLLRPGSLKKEVLEEVLGTPLALYTEGPKSSPGMKYRHYAPQVPVQIFSQKEKLEAHLKTTTSPLVLSTEALSVPHYTLEAKTLYHFLRLADEEGYDEVVIFSEKLDDEALLNRLEKISYASHRY